MSIKIEQKPVSMVTAKALCGLNETMSEPAQCLGSRTGFIEVRRGPNEVRSIPNEVTHKAGIWTGWQGLYWLVEVSTGIISYHGSANELRERVVLDRLVQAES